MKLWNDLTKINGKYAGKETQRTLLFFAGYFITIGSAFFKWINIEAGLTLLVAAGVFQGMKGIELLQHRKLDIAAATGEPVMNAESGTSTATATATVVSESE